MKISFLTRGVMTVLYPSSDKDPGGLLLLPEKGDLANMDISEVLAVMNTLLSVAAREVTNTAPFPWRHGSFPFSPHYRVTVTPCL